MNNGIQTTTDYGMFKTIKGNRELHKTHLAKLTVSIIRKNMLSSNPILVNEEMAIIDGQHRLEIAKQNKLQVYYIIVPTGSISDVIALNANKKVWNMLDYINSYAIRGNDHYIWLKQMMEDYSITATQASILTFGGEKNWIFDWIKDGRIEVSEPERKKAEEKIDIFYRIRPFVHRRGPMPKSLLKVIYEMTEKGLGEDLYERIKKHGSFSPEGQYDLVQKQVSYLMRS